VLGVGIGAFPYEWEYCGEEPDQRVRGDMLDEHLEVLASLWSGEPVGTAARTTAWTARTSRRCATRRRCTAGIPVWVAATWPATTSRMRPFARAARWQGVVPRRTDGRWEVEDTAGVRALSERLRDENGCRAVRRHRARRDRRRR
jgi:hypothetical protein